MTTINAGKHLIFFILVGMVAGCKLAVIVVEGGEVETGSSGICVSSAICVVDVSDPHFSDTFGAVPDEGWYFVKWNSGDRFFCGGTDDPTCNLSFQGHAENQWVEDMVASSEVFYLMPIFKPYQDIIQVNGKEWLQPRLFTNLSWNDIYAVCPEGACSGVLNDYDVTGWTWASLDDVNALFNHYIGRDELGPGPDWHGEEYGSEWGTAFFSDGWRNIVIATGETEGGRGAAGWVRTLADDTNAYMASLGVDVDGPGLQGDIIATGFSDHIEEQIESIGAWFYRTP